MGSAFGIGVMDSEPNIRNKLSRGKFTAVFFIQCLRAIEASALRPDLRSLRPSLHWRSAYGSLGLVYPETPNISGKPTSVVANMPLTPKSK